MQERDRSELGFLILGLLRTRERSEFERQVERISKRNGKFSRDVEKALKAVIESLPDGELDEPQFRKVAERLLKTSDSSKQQAGRAVASALELQSV